MRPYLDYYENYNVIPVRQDTTDLRRHLARRSGLYRQLGIVPSLLEGKSIIEFGPGSGDNAIHTVGLNPKKYVLVDANPASINALRQKFESQSHYNNVQIVTSDIQQYKDTQQYDVVLAEGVIPNQKNSADFCKKIAGFVKPGGVLVLTTQSEVSVFAELCRRMLRGFFECKYNSFEELVEALVVFFTPDLDSLGSMSRRYDDWVIDQILPTWTTEVCFSVPKAIKALGGEFDVYNASPSFIEDWRWYKSIDLPDKEKNQLALEYYYRSYIYFIDYRLEAGQVANRCYDPIKLQTMFQAALDIEREFNGDKDESQINNFLSLCTELASQIKPIVPSVANAIQDYVGGVMQMQKGYAYPDFGSFRGLFGRGQQYMSFIKN
jgi:ubiquinone/menaquinone biosynthesis C-methylase UbiE